MAVFLRMFKQKIKIEKNSIYKVTRCGALVYLLISVCSCFIAMYMFITTYLTLTFCNKIIKLIRFFF